MPIKAAVIGLGNIGRYAIEALETQPDFTCVGVVRRKESIGKEPNSLRGVPEYAGLAELEAVSGKPDVVLLCAPSRKIPEVAGDLLAKGYNTVDSFDIHDRIVETLNDLEARAREGRAVAITAAGWDPGTDSVMRALFEAMAPVAARWAIPWPPGPLPGLRTPPPSPFRWAEAAIPVWSTSCWKTAWRLRT